MRVGEFIETILPICSVMAFLRFKQLIITLGVDVLTSQPHTVLVSLFPSLDESRRFPKRECFK